MKKFGAFLLAGVLAIGALTGCGSTDKKAESSTGSTDTQVIKVAASATPHAEILEEAKPLLAKERSDLQVTVFDDYVQPNEVVDSGDFDANYFQHVPYMEQFNKEKGTKLVDAGDIHYEPFGIYTGTNLGNNFGNHKWRIWSSRSGVTRFGKSDAFRASCSQ